MYVNLSRKHGTEFVVEILSWHVYVTMRGTCIDQMAYSRKAAHLCILSLARAILYNMLHMSK